MQIPVQVSFHNVPVSDALEAAAWTHAADLEEFFDRVTSCRVTIDSPQPRHHKGNLYTVRIEMTVPGEEINVNREHRLHAGHADPYLALSDAFHAARRQLQDYVRRMHGRVKAHAGQAQGLVSRLLPDRDSGFIRTPEGREIFFHRHAVVQGDYEQMEAGDKVSFVESTGTEGPSASTVRVMRSHRWSPANREQQQ